MLNSVHIVDYIENANRRFIREVESKYPIHTKHDEKTRIAIFKEMSQIAIDEQNKYLDHVFNVYKSEESIVQKIQVDLFVNGKPRMINKLKKEGIQAVIPFAYKYFDGALSFKEIDNLLLEEFANPLIDISLENEYFEKDGNTIIVY